MDYSDGNIDENILNLLHYYDTRVILLHRENVLDMHICNIRDCLVDNKYGYPMDHIVNKNSDASTENINMKNDVKKKRTDLPNLRSFSPSQQSHGKAENCIQRRFSLLKETSSAKCFINISSLPLILESSQSDTSRLLDKLTTQWKFHNVLVVGYNDISAYGRGYDKGLEQSTVEWSKIIHFLNSSSSVSKSIQNSTHLPSTNEIVHPVFSSSSSATPAAMTYIEQKVKLFLRNNGFGARTLNLQSSDFTCNKVSNCKELKDFLFQFENGKFSSYFVDNEMVINRGINYSHVVVFVIVAVIGIGWLRSHPPHKAHHVS
jgi:hypothetical protein